MKSIIMWTDATKTSAGTVLHYDENTSPAELCSSLWVMLEIACEMDGYELTTDLYEITKELKVQP